MPPKKKTAEATTTAADDGPWKWTEKNDRTLFLMILGRGNLTQKDKDKIAATLSSKTNGNAVRQRINKLREEQRAIYDKLGWTELNGAPAKDTAASATSTKRKSSHESGEEAPPKTKKSRAKKTSKSQKIVQDDDEMGVKEEDEQV